MLFVGADSIVEYGEIMSGDCRHMFLCNPRTHLKLKGLLEDITNTMYMDMSNTEIHAFDIKDVIFGVDGTLFLFKLCFTALLFEC